MLRKFCFTPNTRQPTTLRNKDVLPHEHGASIAFKKTYLTSIRGAVLAGDGWGGRGGAGKRGVTANTPGFFPGDRNDLNLIVLMVVQL